LLVIREIVFLIITIQTSVTLLQMYKLKMLLRRIYIKAFSWEYWPMWIVYMPVGIYYLYLAIKARSFYFFSASNPGIESGGMFFESKWKIFELMPKEYFPNTILVNEDDAIEAITLKMESAEIKFPVIAKPDRGERGWCVRKLNSVEELIDYKKNAGITFLIQSYVDLPLELSVFYERQPSQDKGKITSVTLKKLLSVIGDGKSNIEQLIVSNNRAFLQYNKLRQNEQINFDYVLKKGEEYLLVPYGNHVLGAMFLNYNHIIDEALVNTFDSISKQINGFYFGRYDLRCSSLEDLKNGKSLSILELNGAGAEPAHIYDPSFSYFKAQVVLINYFKSMFTIAGQNNKNGAAYMTYKEYKKLKQLEKEYKHKQTHDEFNRYPNRILRIRFPRKHQLNGGRIISLEEI
jgi:hypothetical protein